MNGTQVAGNNDTFTCANVEGPLNITVSGVEKIPDFYTVVMPATGNGYRVNGEATAARAQDYTFPVTFVNGFRAGEDFTVTVNGTELEDENGGIMDDVTDGVEDMLPETNVPDTDIGGAAPDTDGDGLTNTQDPDDDGDGLPDQTDPDADGDKVDDTDESTGIVGIVLAVIIVLAIIVTILAVVPKKNKK